MRSTPIKNTVVFLLISLFFNAQAQQKLYDLPDMPIVDMHTHLNGAEEYRQCIRTMDEWGGTISITLNRNDTSLIAYARDSLRGRILMAGRGLRFSPREIARMKAAGLVGLKSHLRYHTRASELRQDQIRAMGALNFPFIAMHVADPPEDHYYNEKFMTAQRDAERVIHENRQTNFIMAHGFYLTNRDADIDTLRMFLDRNPNLYVDIVCSKWWDAPQPSYAKLRRLLIDYKDRFLFGTDFKITRHAPAFRFLREKLETAKPLTFGMNGGPGPGLALPLDVLNHIYYWNAARIIPGVREALEKLGYEISDLPPAARAVEPGLDYDPPSIRVLIHEESGYLNRGSFKVTIDLSAYDRGLPGRLEVLDYKKKPVRTLFRGRLKDRCSVEWDFTNEAGEKVRPGFYRLWLILEENKAVESNFTVE